MMHSNTVITNISFLRRIDLKQFSRVQQALSDMTQALSRATKAAERMAEGA